MRILILKWKSFGHDDIVSAFTELGHEVHCFSHEEYNERISPGFEAAAQKEIDAVKPDMIFSSNFYPLMSKAAQANSIPYVAWVYDCPQVMLYSTAVLNSCNYIFVFDSEVYETFKKSGINTFYYMPLGAPVSRFDNCVPKTVHHDTLDAEISFVGALYNEAHNFFDRFEGLSEYTTGYLKAVMEAQMKVYGTNFIRDVLKDEIIADLRKSVPYKPSVDGAEDEKYIYAEYFINRKITSLERMKILRELSEEFKVDLYTHMKAEELPQANFRGPIDYVDLMPYVFKCSKINLNITLRGIHNGIPLRCFDIMGCGGFLLSNYQPDFDMYFSPEEDYVYFEDMEDLKEKCRFYLSHEEERKRIANNGYMKVKNEHTYEIRLKEMIKLIFG